MKIDIYSANGKVVDTIEGDCQVAHFGDGMTEFYERPKTLGNFNRTLKQTNMAFIAEGGDLPWNHNDEPIGSLRLFAADGGAVKEWSPISDFCTMPGMVSFRHEKKWFQVVGDVILDEHKEKT